MNHGKPGFVPKDTGWFVLAWRCFGLLFFLFFGIFFSGLSFRQVYDPGVATASASCPVFHFELNSSMQNILFATFLEICLWQLLIRIHSPYRVFIQSLEND